MAALALAPAKRFSLPSLASLTARPAWSIPCTPSSSRSTLVSAESATSASTTVDSSYSASLATPWYLPALPLLDSLAELFPPLLWAVPKHKVTHSRKSMRSANKGLKNKTNFSHCEACGQIKLAHNVCANCYSQISRRWKREARGDVTVTRSDASTPPPAL